MPDLHSYLLFLVACAAIIATPGPSQALVLARTVSEGWRAGASTAIGLNIGTLVHAVFAAVGLSAVLAGSAWAFALVKFAGAGYLLFLGVKALRAPVAKAEPAPATTRPGSPLRQAIVTGTLNPKVAIFFLAFMPQFVDPARGPAFVQFLLLGATMALLDTAYELMLAWIVARMRTRLSRRERPAAWPQRLSGAVMIALGLRLAAQAR